LNWYDYPISTGPLEGTNNKIKTMQRQAYGYLPRQRILPPETVCSALKQIQTHRL